MLQPKANVPLPTGYSIRELTKSEFSELWDRHATGIFDDDSQIFRPMGILNEAEKQKIVLLRENLGTPYQLRLGIFRGEQFAGWMIGEQESSDTFYMRNSAVLPSHRRKGLYTALMSHVVQTVTEKGFQKIYSRHSATNNDVIIPKLKAGFVISSLEVSDLFGVLVHLVYFPKEMRRRIQIYRVGDIKPDSEIRKLLDIEV